MRHGRKCRAAGSEPAHAQRRNASGDAGTRQSDQHLAQLASRRDGTRKRYPDHPGTDADVHALGIHATQAKPRISVRFQTCHPNNMPQDIAMV